jgi:hypothetical protein
VGPGGGGTGTGDASSTISSFVTYVGQLASTVSGEASNFAGDINNGIMTYENVTSTISTFSTAMGQVGPGGGGSGDASSTISTFITYVSQLASTVSGETSTISSGIATSLTASIEELASTIDGNTTNYLPNNYVPELYVSTLYTSSIVTSGLSQPFIQYGLSGTIATPVSGTNYPGLTIGTYYTTSITLPFAYKNMLYSVHVTYNGAANLTIPLQANITSSNTFDIIGPNATSAHWTTFGSIF